MLSTGARRAVRAWVVLVLVFLYAPLLLVVINAFNSSRSFAFPPSGFTFRWFLDAANSQGMWTSPHRIYLSEFARSDSAGDYFTVRHEILHDLLGAGGHPPVFRTCNLLRV